MSIKKLFESTNKVQEIVSDASAKSLFDEGAESIRNIEQKKIDQERYVPQIDYSKPENFVRFGSARLYYKSALTRIVDYYPYDGSEAEKNEFLNGCLDIERYILDNQYPRTTGYITIGLGSTYNGSFNGQGYGVVSSAEAIDFFGGPGTGSVTSTSLKDLMPRDKDGKYNYSNIYDESIYTTAGLPTDYGSGTRTSNLKTDLDNGVTVEFWMKTGSLNPATQTNKQVIFDMWNQETDADGGRLMIELTSSHGALGLGKPEQRPFLLTVQSGSHTTKAFLSLGDFALHANMGDWNHYAIRMYNTGSNFRAQLYVNGHLNDTATRVPYDLASHVKPSTDGLAGWLSSSVNQERSWPHAIESAYSSADSLQGWWRLNTDPASGVSGKECPDSSGRGRHGTATNLPTFNTSTNPSDYVAVASNTFDGTNDLVNIGTQATWNDIIGTNTNSTRKMTFAAWIRKTGDGGNTAGRIIDFGVNEISLTTTGDEAIRFRANYNGGSSLIWTTADNAFSLNTWTHIAVTYDASGATAYNNDPKFYVNGVEQAISTFSGTRTGTFDGIASGAGAIGNWATGVRAWAGQLADVAVWNSILSVSEIQSIYSAYLINSTTNTVAEFNSKKLKGRIGALQTQPPGGSGEANNGRLSGSLDEFRFWKTKRTSKEIGTNWLKQVRGGVNSDISNTTLGVYYKFNEGITGDAATDSIVLDYAGRVTNGVWTGYSATARNTGSAIVSASVATKEYLDPIIRTNHPSYINLQSSLLDSGSAYDYQNAGSLLNMVPSWIVQEDNENDNTDLKYITHVMGAYFDKLYNQISELPKLRHQTHTSGTYKPISFAEHLPQSLGLYVPEIFIDADVMEKFTDHSENIVFENKLNEAKNLIYQNLYNNLTDIYKSKGTEQAIKNVLKCFNVDDKLLKLKVNSNNTEFVLRNNLQQHLVRKNFLNFSYMPNNNAVIYQKVLGEEFLPLGINEALRAGVISGNTQPGPARYDTTNDGAIDLTLPGFQAGYGYTHEANILFPDYDAEHTTNLKLRPNFKQMSLFGAVTPKNSVDGKSGADLTTETTNNYSDFKVYFVRDELESKSGFFKLVAANPDDSTITLTSSVFNDVYNNELWNLSVRIKPYNYPLSNFVSGNISTLKAGQKNKYEIVFTGYNAQSTDLFNSFKVSSEVSTATGTRMIGSMKRLYAGAHRTNVIGDVQYHSDVLVSSVASWARYIEDDSLKQHALDIENVGISGSNQSLFGLDRHNVFKETRNSEALVLNWNFRSASTISTADPGVIYVQDFSSGSVDGYMNKFGWVGQQSGLYYQAEGRFFEPNSTKHLSKKRINSYKFIDPERPISSDMVQIFTDEDDLTPKLRRQEILPNFVYSLEKSLYDAVSEEMLDFFDGVANFNNIIGHPVHYYRHRYKEMEKLREIFFKRVNSTSTVEKYTEYYKWFDDALTTIISQLIPASGEYVNDIQNVIESHVLERNKYQNRINIFDSNKFQLDRIAPPPHLSSPTLMGPGGVVEFKDLSGPKSFSPRNTKIRAKFWKNRANRAAREITSGDATIDAQRNKIRDVITSTPFVSSSELSFLPTLRTTDGTKYTAPSFMAKTTTSLINLNVSTENKSTGRNLPNRLRNITNNIKAGVNFESVKNFDFAASITRPGGPINSEGGKFVPLNVMLGFVSESTEIPVIGDEDRPKELLVRQKKIFKVQTGRDWESGLGYKNVKSSMAFPFNVYSCSVELSSGYNAAVVDRVGRNLMITNVHNDVYGDQLEKPMQGIFTNDVVGGHQSRHIDLNTGTDQQNNRPEAWRILLGTCDGVPTGAIGVVGADYPPPNAPAVGHQYPYRHHEKAYLYRDFIAKRPVNIKNINTIKNNKTVPGNFEHQYEIVHSFGATNNPRAFIENQPTLPAQLSEVNSTTNVRSLLSVRRTNDSHVQFVDEYSTAYLSNNLNKTIALTRFSAPGGIEVMSKGYLDFKASEMSPYNARSYRNLTVRRPSQAPSGSFSRPESDISGDTTDIQVSDIHNKDFGLRAHLARHSAKFGRDPVATEAIEYNLNKGMHVGYPRSTYSSNSPSGWWRLRTNVSSAGNITDSSGNGRNGTFDAAGDRPAFSTTLFPNSLIQEASCTFDGSDDAVNIGAGSLWQTIIGTGTGGTKKMTFAIWLRKTGDGGTGFGRIFGFGRDATNGQISIHTNGSEQIFFKTDWNGGTSNIWSTGASLFNLNTWTHLAITYDASSTTYDPIFYVNGVPVALVSNPTPSGNWDGIASGQNCYIGNSSQGNKAFEGQLADAGIWNTILTADEIAALYRVGTLSNPDLITATSPAPPGETYTQLPSFHKINRNTRQVIKAIDGNNSVFITSSKFDNAFIQRPIPQSDRQYMWLSNSVENVSDIRYAGFQNVNRGDQFDPYRTSSAGIEFYWTFVTGSSAKTGSIVQPTSPLNIIIEDPISSSTHTRGFPATADVSNYTNKSLVGNTPNTNYLNQLLTSRGATYGWGWQKTHQTNNRTLVNEKRLNQLIIATGSDSTLSTYSLRPLSMKGRLSYINFDMFVPVGRKVQTNNVTLQFTNTNEKIFFNELSLNNYAEIDYNSVNEPFRDAIAVAKSRTTTLNWFLYKQNMFPSLKNEFGPFSSKRVGYDNKFWRNSRTDRNILGNTLGSSIMGIPVSKSSWPLDAPINFLTRTSIYSPTSGSAATQIPSLNDMSYFTDATFTPLTGAIAYNLYVPAAGELQNTYYSYFTVNIDGPQPVLSALAPLYARKHVLGTPHSVVSPGGVKIPETGSWGGVSNTGFDITKQIKPFAGEAVWEAAEQAGLVFQGSSSVGSSDRPLPTTSGSTSVFVPSASNPWYNDYDDYKSDLKLMAKGYAVVPEYRMSEHVKDYFNFGINNKSKQDMFEIVGTNSSSANRNFYIDYSNSDFLENFLGIKKASLLKAKEIKLTCHAAIKYNPYKGFYPAQRTVQLTKQFADSFSRSIQGSFMGGGPPTGSGYATFDNQSFGRTNLLYQRIAGIIKPAFDSLVSPGILFNSIKSGIAVDYPIVSNPRKRLRRLYGTDTAFSTDNYALSITGSTNLSNMLSGTGEYLGGQYWDKRIPFEAIIEPRKYILNTTFVEMESHPSMSIEWRWDKAGTGAPADIDTAFEVESFSSSFSDNADGVYSLMARNFFGACGEFFLQGAGITKLESNTVLDDLQFAKDSNFANNRPLYMARIKLRKSHNGARTYDKESDSYSVSGAFSYFTADGAKRTLNGTQSVGTYALPQDPMRNERFKETFTMYSRPTAFGPPCAGRPTGSNAFQFPFVDAARDSFSGFNPAFTPPYYDGEAWADLIFRPSVVDKSDAKTAASETYDLNRILNETQVVCWRFDAGEPRQTGPTASHASQPVLIPVAQTQNMTFAFGSDTKSLYGAGSGSSGAVNYIKLYGRASFGGAGRTIYNVWFNDGSGDAAPAATVAGTAVQVDISSGGSSSAAHYADKFKTVINALSDFTATVDGAEVTVKHRYIGNAAEATKEGTISPITISYSQPSGLSPSDDKTVPSIYDGKRINVNSMQLTSSVKIFGTEKVLEQEVDKFGRVIKDSNKPVGTKWIIQPKWETPMLNFNDEGVHPIKANAGTLTLPTYGSASVPRGIWHQFGVIPDDPNTGIFLEITDIPEDWLRNHYEVLAGDRETPYNGNAIGSTDNDQKRMNLYKHVRSLSSLCGFDQTNSSVKLGSIKESFAVHEAIVAVPYIINEVNEPIRKRLRSGSKFKQGRKRFIAIPKRRFAAARDQSQGSAQGDSLSTAGESIRLLKQHMEKYVFPPEFDFLNNKEVDPIAMYVFEFKYEFDRDDLSYIWQNIAPRDHEKITFQKASVSHNLANNELINEEVLNSKNLRWMVFKVKQRAKTDYYDLIADQANESTRQVKQKTTKLDEYKFGFNWPYDYLSFVELIKMDADILLKKDE